ncbi:MAG: hypothetical protein ABI898_07970 [Sphingomonadales bacterium]
MARTPKTKADVTETVQDAVAAATAAVAPAVDSAKLSVTKVKEQASALGTEAVDTARKAATQGKDMAAEALSELSKLAEGAAKVVDERVGEQYGDYARKAATSVGNAASTLQNKDIDAIVSDTKEFVRKRPAIAIGAVAAVGLFLTQLLRRSSKKTPDDKA